MAVVVMFEVEFNADITFELRLKPPAFKLAPVMLPVTDTNLLLAMAVTEPPVVL